MTGSADEALATHGLGFVYPDGTRALRNVSLSIAQGVRLAIVGQNGSGKSTLVRHFNGLLRASEGTVSVHGRDVGRRHVSELSSRVAIAFQNPDRQIFSGSVRSEVAFGPRNLGFRGPELESAVASALAAVGLTDEAATNPYDLGYSQRKLLTIASVLAMRTPIVILDEPTTGQDARGVRTIEGIVAALADEGRTVIVISHDLRFVAQTVERVVVMRDGRVVLDGTPREVFAERSWSVLGSTNLEPPYAARVGAKLDLGSTPTDTAVVEALITGRHAAG